MSRVLNEFQRDQLGQVAYRAWVDGLRRGDPMFADLAAIPWEQLEEYQREMYRDEAEAVVEAYLRSGR